MSLSDLGESLKPFRLRALALCTSLPHTSEAEIPVYCESYDSELDLVTRLLFQDLWKDDPVEIRFTLKRLADLCFEDSDQQFYRHKIYQLGGFSLLVDAMYKWMDIDDILAEACRVFLNICSEDDGANEEIRSSACAAGALEVILSTMRRHSLDSYVQRVGCGALYALTKYDAVTSQRAVVQLGGAFAVVQAMRRHPKCKRLQMWACCTIASWAHWEVLQRWILDAGAIATLDSVTKLYRNETRLEDIAIQDKARYAIRLLSPQTRNLMTYTIIANRSQFCESDSKKVEQWSCDVEQRSL